MKRYAPATERNRDPIASVLSDILPANGLVLEVASGTGEHAVQFARLFPELDWQSSDRDPGALNSIAAWAADAGLPNLRPPIALDAVSATWPIDRADAVICINMVHISPWPATLGLLTGTTRLLPSGGLLYLYGPYRRRGFETAPSNVAFDASLRTRNPDWGVRDLDAVIAAAEKQGLRFDRVVEMPANNLSVAFRRS